MRRSALKTFFERLVVASLPLVFATCDSDAQDTQDLSVIDLPVVVDLEYQPDLWRDLYGVAVTCEQKYPDVTVIVPGTSANADAGANCYGPDVCTPICPTGYIACCGPSVPDGGAGQAWQCFYDCGPAGRRPSGLKAGEVDHEGCEVGQYFAKMAHLEAASVYAFRKLARELKAHGAPAHLVRAARTAARDEIRHARITARIARAHGGVVPAVDITASAPRSLEEIAVENATEGCVRETFGALLAHWQAHTAQDASVREAMQGVAADETRHAELAWAVDAWAARVLAEGSRRRVVESRRAAADAMASELLDPPARLATVAGLPSAAQSRHLFAATAAELWA